MPSLLLHSCCAPCSTYTVEYWRDQGLEVSGLWFNPNIHPYQEHQRRLEAMKYLSQVINLPLIILPSYEMVEFLRKVAGKEADRCLYCFDFRLSTTAELCKERGYDAFSSTLLISPHQKHDLLKKVGQRVAEERGIKFLYADLRPYFHRTRQLTQTHNLYRQKYCGCIYSEWERFAKIIIPSPKEG